MANPVDINEKRLPFERYEYVEVEFPRANEDVPVPLVEIQPIDPELIRYEVVRQSGSAVIYQDASASRRAWRADTIYLRASSPTKVRLLLFVESAAPDVGPLLAAADLTVSGGAGGTGFLRIGVPLNDDVVADPPNGLVTFVPQSNMDITTDPLSDVIFFQAVPSGNTEEVQFNDSGAFGADSTFKFDQVYDTLHLESDDAHIQISGDPQSVLEGGSVYGNRALPATVLILDKSTGSGSNNYALFMTRETGYGSGEGFGIELWGGVDPLMQFDWFGDFGWYVFDADGQTANTAEFYVEAPVMEFNGYASILLGGASLGAEINMVNDLIDLDPTSNGEVNIDGATLDVNSSTVDVDALSIQFTPGDPTISGRSTLLQGVNAIWAQAWKYLVVGSNTTIDSSPTASNVGLAYFATANSSNTTIILPAVNSSTLSSVGGAGQLTGRVFAFKHVGATNSVIIDGFSSETIDGNATITLRPGQAIVIEARFNVGWHIIATHMPLNVVVAGQTTVVIDPGEQLTFVEGDAVTITTSGNEITYTIADEAITFAKMQHINTDRLLGRDTAGTGDVEEISLGASLEFSGAGSIQRAALTGDVTASANSNTTTIADEAVTYAKMQHISAASRLLGRGSAAGAGDVEEITLGTGLSMSGTVLSASGSGDVTASANITDHSIVRGDGGAKGVQDSGVLIDDSDNVSGMATLTLPNSGLHLLDTNASHDLIIAPGSDITADRTLTIKTPDSDMTVDLSSWESWSPTWSTSGTAPSVGDGTLVGFYQVVGKAVHFWLKLTFGSTTDEGTGLWSFDLPVASTVSGNVPQGFSWAFDNSTGGFYAGFCTLQTSTSVVPRLYTGDGSGLLSLVQAGAPFSWETSDSLAIGGTYEAS